MDQLIDVIKNNQNLILRGEILSKNSEYFTLHNTTDVYGFKSLFYTCCEIFNNKVEIYAQDIFSSNFLEENNKNKEEGKDAMLQFYLYEPSSRQSVNIIFYVNFFVGFAEFV